VKALFRRAQAYMLTQDYIEAKQDLDLALRAEPTNRCGLFVFLFLSGFDSSIPFHHFQKKKLSTALFMPFPSPVLAWSALVCGRRGSVTDLANLVLQNLVQT